MNKRDWATASAKQRHRPPHNFVGEALFITAATHKRQRLLGTPDRRDAFDLLMRVCCERFHVQRFAWVILPDHYHVILKPETAEGVAAWMQALHRESAGAWDQEDETPGRQCWYQYWDTSLWTPGDLWSRVNYIHYNPVKHGYARTPEEWRWSSFLHCHSEWGQASAREGLERFPPPRKLPHDEF